MAALALVAGLLRLSGIDAGQVPRASDSARLGSQVAAATTATLTASRVATAAPTRALPTLPPSRVPPLLVRDGISLSLLGIEPRSSAVSGDIIGVSFAFTNETEHPSLVRFNYDEIALSDDTRRSFSSGTYSGPLTGNFVLIESRHGDTSFTLAPGETKTLAQYFRGTISPQASKMLVSFGVISASGPSFTFVWPLF